MQPAKQFPVIERRHFVSSMPEIHHKIPIRNRRNLDTILYLKYDDLATQYYALFAEGWS